MGGLGMDASTEIAVHSDFEVRDELLDYIRFPQFKRLLDKVASAQLSNGFRSIAVLSKFPREGRTFFVAVLALGYAIYLRRRVLIVDTLSANRENSFYLDRVLGSRSNGERNGARPYIDLMTAATMIRRLNQRYGSLHVGPDGEITGPPALSETPDFQVGVFLDELESEYDLVLLDTCALTTVDKQHLDPVILARQADSAILVTSHRSSERDVVQQVNDELHRSHVELLGTIFNNGAWQ